MKEAMENSNITLNIQLYHDEKIVCKLLLLLGILPIISCSSDQEFYPIELTIEGIEFIKMDRLTLSAEVPSEGLNFSITTHGQTFDSAWSNC